MVLNWSNLQNISWHVKILGGIHGNYLENFMIKLFEVMGNFKLSLHLGNHLPQNTFSSPRPNLFNSKLGYMTLLRSITMLCGIDNIPHNTIMDLNNVMYGCSRHRGLFKHGPYHSNIHLGVKWLAMSGCWGDAHLYNHSKKDCIYPCLRIPSYIDIL